MNRSIIERDQDYVWHPYSSSKPSTPPLAVASTNKHELILSDGTALIDGMSSWWCTIHGYNHPELNRAAKEQIDSMSHVMFGGLTHEPAVMLCERLVAITPDGLDRVFIVDSGSVAVEVAMKMAMQYWQALNQPNKRKVISLRRGYHGDTLGAMSVCDPVTGMHSLFEGSLTKQIFVDEPPMGFNEQNIRFYVDYLDQQLSQHKHEAAAFILEPIVQGAGGMRFYSPAILKAIRELCDRHDILLIADEIATGFGRTGKLFACEWADISPDILCLGKALTGGYMSLAATLCTKQVADTISSGEAGCFMHGPTFMGNPLACAVANMSIELLSNSKHSESNWQQNVASIERALVDHLMPLSEVSGVQDVRVLGAIGVVELDAPVDMGVIQAICTKHGIWLRPFGKLVYTMPHFNCQGKDLTRLCTAMANAIDDYLKEDIEVN